MYRVFPVEGGWQIFWCPTPYEKVELSDKKVYPQPQGAQRRKKQLNDSLKEVDKMIKRDGAIIL